MNLKMFKHTLLALLFAFSPICSAFGQGFMTFNGRNHPELDWQQAETEHFKIMYPAHLAGIEIQASAIAEATYTALSENLGITFDDKIRMYLSDEDEILNGFAVSPFGFTNIWVHVNEVASGWTGNTKWLRTVISHELAHIFHGRAVKGNIGMLSYLLGNPMPGFWTEGFAQYETELWDAYRGDQWLRTAVLDDQLSYNDGRSIWNGRLLYAAGNAQVRYFAEQYGDSTIKNIMHNKKKALFGLVKYHDFFPAFKEETGKSYSEFYDEWRRHMNVYYNTLAGQTENADSLDAPPLSLPGQYIESVQYSPDTSQVAVLSITSISRPVRRLHVIDRESQSSKIVAEGSIQPPIAWSPDSKQLAFARRTRARNGSILNDLFVVNNRGKKERRLTHGRRASSPTFAPDGNQIAFIGSSAGTANVFLLDPTSGEEQQLTHFEGDVQLASIEWNSAADKIAIGRFDADGSRDLLVLDPTTQQLDLITQNDADEQFPVWSPDGRHLAFTSMQDDVPNVFSYELATQTKRRVTNLMTGARLHQWLPPDSIRQAGSLVLTTRVTKQRDRAFRVDASRVPFETPIQIPAAYSSWTQHRPPAEIPHVLPDNPELITGRSKYRSGKNLVHLMSFGLPYYNASDDWGLAGVTSWTEPLGQHTFGATVSASIPTFRENSFFLASYINNQLRPSLGFTGYSLLPTAVAYGNRYLLDSVSGGDITIDWPLDIAVRPYTATRLNVKVQYAAVDQLNEENYEDLPEGLLAPESGERATLEIGFTRKTQRPYSGNIVHPLDGTAIKAQVSVSEKLLGGDLSYFQGDVAAYTVLPAIGLSRLFVYGRGIFLNGNTFNQDRPGFARFDDIQITAPQFGMLAFSDAVRVRGYREFAYGDRVLFGSAEYRMPFLPSLQTTILGLLSFRATTLSGFVDAGIVRNNDVTVTRRVGAGLELKNALVIGGMLQIMHAFGIAQPASDLGTEENYEVYYRVRASLPF